MFFAALVIWSASLETRKLMLTDEGRYADVPRHMVASGDWVTPRLNGVKYFEKPPLQYWATAAAYQAFGIHHWTARLWPALTGMLGVMLVFYAGCRLFGPDIGLYAALVLGSSFLYVVIGHLNTLDMGLTFSLGLALAGTLLALRPHASTRENLIWILVAWAGCALAVLSKGLIGIALPVAVVILYMLIKRDFALWKKLHLASGCALFLLISAPWFIAVSLANPEFPQFFFIHEHIARYTTTVHQRLQPWYYFIPVLLLGMLPWIFTLLDSMLRVRSKGERAMFDPIAFLWIWCGFTLVFFSSSHSKLASYILPMFPALALLIAVRLASIGGRALAWQLAPIALVALAGLALAPQLERFASNAVPAELHRQQVPWLMAGAAIAFAGLAYAACASWRGNVRRAVIVTAFACLLTAQVALTGYDSRSPSGSTYHIAKRIEPYLKLDTPFYSIGIYEQSLPFYLRRSVTLVANPDELAFGLAQEPQLWVPDIAGFEQRWRSHGYALAITDPAMFEQLREARLPMQELARDTKRVVVRTLPAAEQGGNLQ